MRHEKQLPRKIEVHAYSGYKANERPTSFRMDDRLFKVNRIVDRWYGVTHDYFKVLAEDGAVYLLQWNRILDLWFLSSMMKREGKH